MKLSDIPSVRSFASGHLRARPIKPRGPLIVPATPASIDYAVEERTLFLPKMVNGRPVYKIRKRDGAMLPEKFKVTLIELTLYITTGDGHPFTYRWTSNSSTWLDSRTGSRVPESAVRAELARFNLAMPDHGLDTTPRQRTSRPRTASGPAPEIKRRLGTPDWLARHRKPEGTESTDSIPFDGDILPVSSADLLDSAWTILS